jgi:hypothetical protein
LSILVAVAITGTGNRVMTSPDGITWTARTSAADNDWLSMTWSPELSMFVAVGNGGTGNRVMTSPNGISWTTRASAADNIWRSVTWSSELSIFVAVATSGTGNRVMTSPNGINWTTRTSAADNGWYYVTWSPELSIFAAVAISGTGNRVMTSPDGITWTLRTFAADVGWYSIIWAPELSIFVAVGNSGTNNGVMTSAIGMPNSKSVVKALPSQMTVLPNGNVGIGTTNPESLLQVMGLGRFTGLYARTSDTDNLLVLHSDSGTGSPGDVGSTISFRNRWFVNDTGTPRQAGIRFIKTQGSGNFGGGIQLCSTNGSESLNPVLTTTHQNFVGIGKTDPAYQLQLSTDSAAKPSTNTWTVASDMRLKECIQIADYDLCYSVLSKLDLKHYKWRDNVDGIGSSNIKDRHKLGWIAQEVEPVFPKAVDTVPEMFGLSNLKTLNADQIYACMYGTIKRLMHDMDVLKATLMDRGVLKEGE